MTSIKAQGLSSLSLAAAWWRQHGLVDRIDDFRACLQPTPRQRTLLWPADGGMLPAWDAPSAVASPSLTRSIASCSLPTTTARDRQPDVPLVLVSACLLSYPVTYRGTHRRLPAVLHPTPLLFLTEVLFKEMGLVQCLPVCPEVQWLGLPAPRVPLRLVRGFRGPDGAGRRGSGWTTAQNDWKALSKPLSTGSSGSVADEEEREVRYLVESTSEDHALLRYDAPNGTRAELSTSLDLNSEFVAHLLQDLRTVDGIILKSYSPSCGVQDARLYVEAAASPSSTVCDPHSCNACQHVKAPRVASVTGRRPAASTSAQRRFDLVDGFFTQQLRSFLASMQSVDGQPSAEACIRAETAAPVVTCDRLLTHFYTEELLSQARSVRDVKKGHVDGVALEAAPNLTSLDTFMESVLQHREQRLSRKRD
ncbi:hypothetical protein CUR178_04914 [Leishmania enriettii]|uniref:Uncharacterized protein n=1 Tax=Leishmania enriettii TaxID=5663 RepID=A0A836H5Z7_LEIEN|nr:hypothetical protein CUR178_04914 [Leishmania enriettii]